MLVLAHAAHWYEGFLYVLPALLTAGWLGLQNRREKRRAAREGGEAGAVPDPPD